MRRTLSPKETFLLQLHLTDKSYNLWGFFGPFTNTTTGQLLQWSLIFNPLLVVVPFHGAAKLGRHLVEQQREDALALATDKWDLIVVDPFCAV